MTPRCVVIGTGRVAGGFITPLLATAGWEVVLAGRDRGVIDAIAGGAGVWVHTGREPRPRWHGGATAVQVEDPALIAAVAAADLLATSVGPSSLGDAGRLLAPLLRARLDVTDGPINIITFENHRRSPELLAAGLIEADPSLAREIGVRVGIGGAAVWRAISKREVTPEGVLFEADDVDECYVDGASLLALAAPLDGSLPGLTLVRSFDDRMVEKLWLFNAGHAAAAYLGWLGGCQTLDQAMARPDVRSAVSAVVAEAVQAFEAHLRARRQPAAVTPRPLEWIIDRYADPTLADPVTRVGREPRRKLAPHDRFIGPAVMSLAAGSRPVALAAAAAAALAYAEPSDRQAGDLQSELELLPPEEVLGLVSQLDPREELTALICEQYRTLATKEMNA